MPILRKNCPNAEVGIVLNFTPAYPLTQSLADSKAAQLADDYLNQWYIKPLLKGCYPDCFADLGAATPAIQPEDFEIMQAPLDYIGINFYTRAVYESDGAGGYRQVDLPDVPRTDMGWEIYPQAFTDLLVDLTHRYQLPPLYITENGCAAQDELQNGQVADLMRVDYYQQHLNAVDAAVRQGVDVRGYFAWSLMDNFEWAEGYTKRFGIVYVDYPTQTRVIKQSGLAYRDFLQGRSRR
jgi:beta-glucosidase